MASCEKCWNDAGGDPREYKRLIEERKNNPCAPEKQAGLGATICPKCGRKTVHQSVKVCMVPDCDYQNKENGERGEISRKPDNLVEYEKETIQLSVDVAVSSDKLKKHRERLVVNMAFDGTRYYLDGELVYTEEAI
jgi:hypothetical protein